MPQEFVVSVHALVRVTAHSKAEAFDRARDALRPLCEAAEPRTVLEAPTAPPPAPEPPPTRYVNRAPPADPFRRERSA